MPKTRGFLALAAGCLLTGSLGSVHAFSVFIAPLEATHGASRGAVSLVYSVALVFLTLSVLLGHRVYGVLRPPAFAAALCLLAAAGLALAAGAETLWLVGIGYGLLFGAANGMGYGFSLVVVSTAMPERRGFAMGVVTGCYAIGALVFALVYDRLIAAGGPSLAFAVMAAVMVAVALAAALLLWHARVAVGRPGVVQPANPLAVRRALLWRLWAAYGTGAAAGLMAIGHAAAIVTLAGAPASQAVTGVMLIALGNGLGGFAVGRLADAWPARRLLAVLPVASAVALFALIAVSGATATIVCLALLGFFYGAMIAAYPVATVAYVGVVLSARAYGRVFTAWGLAGLGAPWLAGVVFDASGGYTPALVLAGVAARASAALAASLPNSD